MPHTTIWNEIGVYVRFHGSVSAVEILFESLFKEQTLL